MRKSCGSDLRTAAKGRVNELLDLDALAGAEAISGQRSD
jgi:hypothetical protein